MKKAGSSSSQCKPKLYINNELIPAIEINESFKYLGRHFDYSMSNQEHKDNLCDTVDEVLKDIDSLPLHPRIKLLIYYRCLLSKISWDLTIADIRMTWIKQTLDNKVSDYIRRWLEMPISGTLDVISLSKQKCGLGFVSVSSRFAQCQNTIRSCLKNPQNSDLRKIYEKTHTNTNLQYDQFNSTREVIKNIRAGKEEQRIGNKLTTQALVVNSIWKHSNKASLVLWSKVITQLPKNIHNFCIRYVNNTLANNTNLHKLGKASSPHCSTCNKPQTLGHVVAGCSVHLEIQLSPRLSFY